MLYGKKSDRPVPTEERSPCSVYSNPTSQIPPRVYSAEEFGAHDVFSRSCSARTRRPLARAAACGKRRVRQPRGDAAASLQEIADRMGILKGSLYHYAQTKEELLYEILQEGHRRATETIEHHREASAELVDEPRTPLSFIRLWMKRSRYLNFAGLGGESHDYTLYFTGSHRTEIRDIRRATSEYLSEVIRSDRQAGFIRHDIDCGIASRSLRHNECLRTNRFTTIPIHGTTSPGGTCASFWWHLRQGCR